VSLWRSSSQSCSSIPLQRLIHFVKHRQRMFQLLWKYPSLAPALLRSADHAPNRTPGPRLPVDRDLPGRQRCNCAAKHSPAPSPAYQSRFRPKVPYPHAALGASSRARIPLNLRGATAPLGKRCGEEKDGALIFLPPFPIPSHVRGPVRRGPGFAQEGAPRLAVSLTA